jgi:hypothetical protein
MKGIAIAPIATNRSRHSGVDSNPMPAKKEKSSNPQIVKT